jgi:hypothetical protein
MLKGRGEKGQLEISFGMIFSILLIIAVLAVSFYAIQYFVNLSTCSSLGLFHDALQKDVDTAWQGSSSRTLFEGDVPGSVDYICFGNMSITPASADRERFEELRKTYRLSTSNVFIYPQKENCGSGIVDRQIKHAAMREFFCIKTREGTIKAALNKNNLETSVTVSAP